MTSREFCYWLQGFFELQEGAGTPSIVLTAAQVQVVKNHLNMVFKHEIDPSLGPPEHQAKLDAAHAGEVAEATAEEPVLTKEQIIELIHQHSPRMSPSFSGETRLKC
jgi:hypothetical protein